MRADPIVERHWALIFKKRKRNGDTVIVCADNGKVFLFPTKKDAKEQAEKDEEIVRVTVSIQEEP